MTQEDDEIPSVGEHRGVKIHDFQPAERVEDIVKPEIDLVHAMTDVGELYDFATNPRNCPEARLFSGAKCRAAHGLAAASRVQRPDVDLEKLQAHTAGLESFGWMDPSRFGTLLAIPPGPGKPDARDIRPADCRAALDEERVRRGLRARRTGTA